MRAGVVSRTDKPDAIRVVKNLVEYLDSKDVKVEVEMDTALALNMPDMGTDLTEMNVDFIITVGGDGTILRTSMLTRDPSTPILGVNQGMRGFLTEVYPKDMMKAIDRVLDGNYYLEECIKLSSRCLQQEGVYPEALNEVLVASQLTSKVVDMRLSIDGEQVIDIQADGALVATPTGSTAYNLSAGGSILAPDMQAMILTTISPYSYFRSIVTPLSSHIFIELLKPKADALAIIDGRIQTALKPKSIIEVWVSPNKTQFIRFSSFYNRLERRLKFRARARANKKSN